MSHYSIIQKTLQTHLVKIRLEGKLDPIQLLAEIVAAVRPSGLHKIKNAMHSLQELCDILRDNKAYADCLQYAVLKLIQVYRPISIFADSGIQPSSGFFSELNRRVSHRVLPEAIDKRYLKDIFALIFTQANDEQWVLALPDEIWLQLIDVLHFEDAEPVIVEAIYHELLKASQILSYRLSSSGLEPELVKNHEDLEKHTSPFIIQNEEITAVVNAENATETDVSHVLIMLDQCRQVITKTRKNSSQNGTSIRLTFLLQRMTQQLDRLETIFSIIVGIKNKTTVKIEALRLFKDLVYAECHKNDIRQHLRENVELLALRVTENASRAGEHYITTTRSEYFKLMRSAAGAGFIIAIMAVLKILIGKQHFAPLTEAILFSLNYGLGFVLIHTLHFTVATKQPAMTAAAIAGSIGSSDGKTKDLDKLVKTISQTMSSQTIAILGNVMVVLPLSILISWLIFQFTGHYFVDVEKARQLLTDNDPSKSGAVLYAGVAGVCLFLSGLIAGYHDNLAIYNKIPQRLAALKWLQKLLGPARLNRFANYIENNLGALAGNFYFGCLLGGMSGLGVLLGLPIDIRHVTFASAFVGFSAFTLDFNFTLNMFLMAGLGIYLIATTNLAVSFGLALYVAMKSRKVNFAQWRLLFVKVLSRLNQHPEEFLLPPKKEAENQTKDVD
ncbi:site-specific recombinase [Methylotenera versatilis]|uniref:site-specific recombinase n=1 Tax=Methylotenera versatilis TaxID=1055487 RepID=UPI000690799F|nr:site-specific recombinase [Methylotenera versatilis]